MRILFFFLLLTSSMVHAAEISGHIRSGEQRPLSFASVIVKNRNVGTTANADGFYKLELKPGKYVLLFQHIGYVSAEKEIEVSKEPLQVDMVLTVRQYDLNAVTVRAGAEDPAYAIIRNAIRARPKYENEYDRFKCEVYLKGRFDLRSFPKKVLGQNVDFEDGDTSQRRTVFLSETVASFSVKGKQRKVEVHSTKVSGDSDGYGFSYPNIVSFYDPVVDLGKSLNPRGFISPLHDNALNYYNYKFRGTFFDNGVEVSRIEMIPKRKYEPVFSGFVNIIENSWRIHSIDAMLLQDQQMQLVDTLSIQQLYIQQNGNWFLRQQVLLPAIKIMAFDGYGSFVQVYDKFDLDPTFKKGYFDNTIMRFEDSSNKRSMLYWDTIRPIALLPDEKRDYERKDSLEQLRKDPAYLDSLDKKQNKYTASNFLLMGKTFIRRSKRSAFRVEPIIEMVSYNTVEGLVVKASPTYTKAFTGRRSLSLRPTLRYGLSNEHFNADLQFSYNYGKKYLNRISVAGGSRVFQFNNANPVDEFSNSTSTYFWKNNRLKLYEAKYGKLDYTKGLGEGFSFTIGAEFQDRIPLENTSFRTYKDLPDRSFTPNYPIEITNTNIPAHQAALIGIGIRWQPGARYIEFPDRKTNIGSSYPTIELSAQRGVKDLLGSDIDLLRWRASISDDVDMKLGGQLKYNIVAGGFAIDDVVYAPDYRHIIGNGGFRAAPYMRSFQLPEIYELSNTSPAYLETHVEYHLNGLLTNKLPLLKKWNWFFVIGANTLNFKNGKFYHELMFSVENIFRVIRVDMVQGFGNNGYRTSGIRFGLPVVR